MGGQGHRTLPHAPIGVTLVLDAHGLTALAANRARLEELRRRGEWPAIVPSVVLSEALTGDHRRDYHENRLLRACRIVPVDELLARSAATLRAKVAHRHPSAVDAVVVAAADFAGGAVVLTSDPGDLTALAEHATSPVKVATT